MLNRVDISFVTEEESAIRTYLGLRFPNWSSIIFLRAIFFVLLIKYVFWFAEKISYASGQ